MCTTYLMFTTALLYFNFANKTCLEGGWKTAIFYLFAKGHTWWWYWNTECLKQLYYEQLWKSQCL